MTDDTNAVAAANTNAVSLDSYIGQKAGMTRIFNEAGNHVPVTVIKLIPNHITQVKTIEKDGYEAYQVGYYEKRENLLKKTEKGHLAKANVENNYVRFAEIKAEGASVENLGKQIAVTCFTPDMYVDVTGTTKGKGFQGVIKRYNFSGGPGAHGSTFHRTTGSIGNRATPGRVWKNKKMPGHMGCDKQTVQNIKIVEVNLEKGYMLIRGSVPGAKNGFVKISKAHKK